MRILFAILTVVLISASMSLVSSKAFAGNYSFIGIGVTIEKKDDNKFLIRNLIANAPAHRAGVRIGEYIHKVDNRPTEKMKFDELIKLIGDGDVGSTLTLTLGSESQQNLHDVGMAREIITIECFMEGNLNLSLSGTPNAGSIWGTVGGESLSLNVNSGRAYGSYRGESLNLDIQSNGGLNQFVVSGWVRSSRIMWNSSGYSIYGYQSCIP